MKCRLILAVASMSVAGGLFAQNVVDSLESRTLDEVIVSASGASRNLKAAEMGRHVIGKDAILKLPVLLGEPDIVRTLHTLPGVSQGMEGFTGLYVHGGDNDQNLFIYGGIPLYHVSHLGGMFSSFNAYTVKNIDFFKSAFPARFGGRISSISDVVAENPNFDKFTGKFTLGLLAANAYISGPIIKDKLAFSAAVRRSWIDIVGIPALAIVNLVEKGKGKKIIAAYNFMDFNARIDWKLGKSNVYALGYYGHDYLKIGNREFPAGDRTYINDDNGIPESGKIDESQKFYDEDVNRMTWGNWGVLLGTKIPLGNGVLTATTYFSRYSSKYSQTGERQTDMSDPSTYSRSYSKTSNSILDFGVNAQYGIQFGRVYYLRGGAGYVRHNYHPGEIRNEFTDGKISNADCNGDPEVESDEVFAYLDNLFNFGEWASLDLGVRFSDHFIYQTSFPRFEPRASLRVSVTPDYSIKLSYARMTQFVQQVSSNYIDLPTDLLQPVGKGMKPLESDQYSIGFYGNLPHNFYFSLEGWRKNMRNLVEYREGISTLNPLLEWNDKITQGKGWAYGADLSVNGEIGKVTGSVSYGLMWNWRKFEHLNDGEKFPAKFDNRHKININATYRLNDHIEFNAGWTFMTGNRITIGQYNYDEPGENFPDAPATGIGTGGLDWEQASGLDYYSGRNNVRLPAYHRLDIGMSIFKTLKNGARTIWNFSLYNAYCHMNAVTIVKENILYSSDDHRRFRKLGLVPVIPSASFTYEF